MERGPSIRVFDERSRHHPIRTGLHRGPHGMARSKAPSNHDHKAWYGRCGADHLWPNGFAGPRPCLEVEQPEAIHGSGMGVAFHAPGVVGGNKVRSPDAPHLTTWFDHDVPGGNRIESKSVHERSTPRLFFNEETAIGAVHEHHEENSVRGRGQGMGAAGKKHNGNLPPSLVTHWVLRRGRCCKFERLLHLLTGGMDHVVGRVR